jgi:hydrogenase-4 component F
MTMALSLVAVPLLFALLAVLAPSDRTRPFIVLAGGAAHLVLVFVALSRSDIRALDGWLELGRIAKLVLTSSSILFFACAIYAVAYLADHPGRSNRLFCGCMMLFIATLTLVTEAQHLGLMWVAIEATTLAAAPMLYFQRGPASLEATWKYLLIGSVAIALALLGSFFLAYAALLSGHEPTLLLGDLVRDAGSLSKPWLRAAFVMLFIGYGTKMGLAPMHAWKPDAYGEAPGLVGALLAGGLTNCAFLAILRFYKICRAAGDPGFAHELMIGAGLLSMVVAGAFMARQRDFKRMLAYSSVEHMGILILGIGLGETALFGAMLHMLNNALTKGALFFSAANIHRAFGAKTTDSVRGALRRTPLSAALFLAAFFAITGSPPFGPFLSEITILHAAVSTGHWVVATTFLAALVVVFMGMGATLLGVVQGEPPESAGSTPFRENIASVSPGFVLLGLVLLLGIWIPAPVERLVRGAAAAIVEPTP